MEAPQFTVISAGQLRIAAVVSTTVMVWTQLRRLLQESVAVQVRVITPLLAQAATKVSENAITTGPQPDVPVAMPVASGLVELPHSTVTSAGQVMLRAVGSTKAMLCTQLIELPQASVAVQVRVTVVPQTADPLSEKPTVALPQLSAATAEPVLDGSMDSPQATWILAGQVRVGGVVSVTVMVCMQLLVLPHESVAVQVRVITRLFPHVARTLSTKTKEAELQLSSAVAKPVLTGLVEAPHSTVTLAGQEIVGPVVSAIVIV
jgi:hypothetical protein